MVQREVKDAVNLVLSIVAIIIPITFFVLTSPEDITLPMIVTFSVIGILLLVFSFWIYFYSRWKDIIDDVKRVKKENDEIKKSLNLNKLFNNMDIRLRVLENLKNKKAQRIDPYIIYWIILLILLYLFLKFAGVLP